MELTDEQEAAVASNARELAVKAPAGSGKTHLLIEYAKRRPSTPMVYLCFGKAVQLEASKRFPKRNVRCVTTHALAFPSQGVKYRHKLGTPRASDVAGVLGIDVVSAGKALKIVNKFHSSADTAISSRHALGLPNIREDELEKLLCLANQAWMAMKNTESVALPMTYDGYLKLYQLSSAKLNTNTILFDEFQDANEVTYSIMERQQANKIYAGDPFQSIFGFRGAIDAFSRIKPMQTVQLTKSFRFGHGIADLATALLTEWRGATAPIVGLGRHRTVFGVNRNAPHAVISRTNAPLFAEAVRLVSLGYPFGFAGGVDSVRFNQVLSAYHLYAAKNSSIQDPFFAAFDDLAHLKRYAEEVDDREIKVIVRLIEDYRHDIPKLIDAIKREARPELSGQEVALGTTHKMKGLEFMDVVLTDDFTDLAHTPDPNGGPPTPPDPEEIHALYVALTRVMRGVELPPQIRDWLARTGRSHLAGQDPPALASTFADRSLTPECTASTADEHFQAIATQLDILVDLCNRQGASASTRAADLLRECQSRLTGLDQSNTTAG